MAKREVWKGPKIRPKKTNLEIRHMCPKCGLTLLAVEQAFVGCSVCHKLMCNEITDQDDIDGSAHPLKVIEKSDCNTPQVCASCGHVAWSKPDDDLECLRCSLPMFVWSPPLAGL
jgi:hypothetical protein